MMDREDNPDMQCEPPEEDRRENADEPAEESEPPEEEAGYGYGV
jgi:hypothetical protein